MAVSLDKVLTVRDGVTGAPYWQLTRADDAGRYRTEVLGNGTTTERTYFDAKQRVIELRTHSLSPVTVLDFAHGRRRQTEEDRSDVEGVASIESDRPG